jgi:hypothetical protein
MIVRITAGAMIIALCACSKSGESSNTAADADASGKTATGERTLAEGTPVCLQAVAGQRYPIVEALEEQDLEVVESCIRAEALVAEEGEAGAFVLRYQMMGDPEWKSCTSSADERLEFLDECTAQLVSDLGGAAGSSAASADSDAAE